MRSEIKNIWLIINTKKEKSKEVAKKIINFFNKNKVKIYLPMSNAKVISDLEFVTMKQDIPDNIDYVLVLGGDGTLLNTARNMVGKNIPILGINLGQLGFLTEIELDNLIDGLQRFCDGKYQIEERMMLYASVERNGLEVDNYTVLNDIVVTKGAFARLIELETYVGECYVSNYTSDGLIVSSPTGSTAYSLSAGGPIAAPDLEVIIFTPICPHSLHARPIIISPDKTVRVVVRSKNSEVMLTVDGQYGFKLQEGDIISITKSKYKTKLVRLEGRSFYYVLREKLRDGER